MASELGSSTVKKILQVSSGSGMHLFHRSKWGCGLMDTQHIAFPGFSSEYALDSEKIPDVFVKVVGIMHPSVVVETGWAEKMADLKKDAEI